MGESTAIAWCDHTFNPWWGCTRVSPACQNCYAEAFAKRTGHKVWGNNAPRRFFGDKHWAEPLRWNRRAEDDGVRRKVFCASMADVFEPLDELNGSRERLWDLIGETPSLDWLLLTKRPEHIRELVPPLWLRRNGAATFWPHNVWVGTTVEDQQRAEERIPTLLDVDAAPVRFLSCEPLLERVEFDNSWFNPNYHCVDCGLLGGAAAFCRCSCHEGAKIDWVICGGESGPRHRPLDLDHARHLRDQCEAFGVPFFFKQVGGHTPTAGGDELDGLTYKQVPRP